MGWAESQLEPIRRTLGESVSRRQSIDEVPGIAKAAYAVHRDEDEAEPAKLTADLAYSGDLHNTSHSLPGLGEFGQRSSGEEFLALQKLVAALREYIDRESSSDPSDAPEAILEGHDIHDAVVGVQNCYTTRKLPASARVAWMDWLRVSRGDRSTDRPNEEAMEAAFELSQWAAGRLAELQRRGGLERAARTPVFSYSADQKVWRIIDSNGYQPAANERGEPLDGGGIKAPTGADAMQRKINWERGVDNENGNREREFYLTQIVANATITDVGDAAQGHDGAEATKTTHFRWTPPMLEGHVFAVLKEVKYPTERDAVARIAANSREREPSRTTLRKTYAWQSRPQKTRKPRTTNEAQTGVSPAQNADTGVSHEEAANAVLDIEGKLDRQLKENERAAVEWELQQAGADENARDEAIAQLTQGFGSGDM